MKKLLIPVSLILALSILGFVNFVYPLISIFYPNIRLDLKVIQYCFVLTSYFCLFLILWLDKNQLDYWNLEKYSTLLLIAMCFVRIRLNFFNEQIFRVIIFITGILILIVAIHIWGKIPKTSLYWSMFGFLSCGLVIPLAFIESIAIEKYAVSTALYQTKFFGYLLHNLSYTLAFIAPYEELVLRGVLWGQLRKWNISEVKIAWIQGLLTWLLHFWQLTNPITFFIAIPIQTFILTTLVKSSKQLFPSIISHSLVNLLLPIVMSKFFA